MNECAFCECDEPIEPDYDLCYRHNRQRNRGSIDECPSCDRFKRERYKLCIFCISDTTAVHAGRSQKNLSWIHRDGPSRNRNQYELESSPAWEEGDAEAPYFHVYILKLKGGGFYAGQTRELHARLSEHRDGRVRSTAGLNPKLVWFLEVPSREVAVQIEREIKEDIATNQRIIQILVTDFQALVSELDFSPNPA